MSHSSSSPPSTVLVGVRAEREVRGMPRVVETPLPPVCPGCFQTAGRRHAPTPPFLRVLPLEEVIVELPRPCHRPRPWA